MGETGLVWSIIRPYVLAKVFVGSGKCQPHHIQLLDLNLQQLFRRPSLSRSERQKSVS